jgi:hypothetical protein
VRYALLVYSNPATPDPEAVRVIGAEYMAFSQKIIDSGEMVGGDPLEGVDAASSVRVRDGKLDITPGPFAATAEVLSGYYLVDVKDLDRALELAEQIPDARTGTVEVRPLGAIPNLT